MNLKKQGVDAIIGSTWSFPTSAIVPIAGREKTVLINTSTLWEAFDASEGQGYFFGTAANIDEDSAPFAQYLLREQPKTVTLISTSSRWGIIQRDRYKQIAESRNMGISDVIEPIQQDQNDWIPIIPRIVSKTPDLLTLTLNKNDIEQILRRAHEQNLDTKFFGSKNTYDAFRLSSDPRLYEGICFSYPLEHLKSIQNFNAKFTARFHEVPRIYADYAYDAVYILTQALELSQKRQIDLKSVIRSERFKTPNSEYAFGEKRSFTDNHASSLACVVNGRVQSEAGE